MSKSWTPARRSILLAAFLLVVVSCGGGDSDDGGAALDGAGTGAATTVADGSAGGGSTEAPSGGGDVGPLTQTADPGQAWVEVDGQRLEYQAAGSLHYECDVREDRITVNYQSGEGHDFNLQASLQPDGWIGNLTVTPGGGETTVNYGATIGFDPGTLGLGDQAVSYEGTLSRVEDFDVQNARDVTAKIAVNCGSSGTEPVAEIGGQAFAFPLSGAQSVDCTIADDNVEIIINRLASDDSQLQISARDDGQRWIGAVTVITGDDTYSSPIPEDGSGLTIQDGTVAYEGVFSSSAGDLDGSVSASCS